MKAHRIILCACSSYFQNILKSINPAQHPVLLLSDVRLSDMTALMDFIYFGQVCFFCLSVPWLVHCFIRPMVSELVYHGYFICFFRPMVSVLVYPSHGYFIGLSVPWLIYWFIRPMVSLLVYPFHG